MAGKDFSGAVAELLRYCSDLPDAEVTEADGSMSVPPAPVPPPVVLSEEEPWTDERWHHECHLFTAYCLAERVAHHYDLDLADVLGVLQTVPDNLGGLIGTPQGWTVLAEQIFLTLGGSPGGVLLPSIH